MKTLTFPEMRELVPVLKTLEEICLECRRMPKKSRSMIWPLIKYVLVDNIGFSRPLDTMFENHSVEPFLYTSEAYDICYFWLLITSLGLDR